MKIIFAKKPKEKDPLVVFAFEGDNLLEHPLLKFLNKEETDYLRKSKKMIVAREGQAKMFILPGTERPLVVLGFGKTADFNFWKPALGVRNVIQFMRKERMGSFSIWAGRPGDSAFTRDFFENLAANEIMANFEDVTYKTPPPEGFFFVKEVTMVNDKGDKDIEEGIRRGIIVGEETNSCRTLSNTPGGDMTPAELAAHAMKAAQGLGVTVTILDEKKIKSLGMGGVMGVGKGSDSPPRFIIMEYMKGPKTEKPTVLVGKGVTFDSGGLNLKPSDHIYEMHMDMSGGAAVIHTLIAAARLKLKKNIVVLVPAVENMVSGSSYHPGDVLRTLNGKTIEVLNTDAEGRVILSDALEYANKYKPGLVVDVATLTGAAVVALGQRYTALFTADKKLEERFRSLGEATGDRVWPLPMSAEYEDDIRGTFGDWANTGKTRYGGATTAAVFLWQFAKNYPWVHLDIAPRMTSIEGEYLAKGAAGAPVRLLVRLLEAGY